MQVKATDIHIPTSFDGDTKDLCKTAPAEFVPDEVELPPINLSVTTGFMSSCKKVLTSYLMSFISQDNVPKSLFPPGELPKHLAR